MSSAQPDRDGDGGVEPECEKRRNSVRVIVSDQVSLTVETAMLWGIQVNKKGGRAFIPSETP